MFDKRYWEDRKEKKVAEFEAAKTKALAKFLDVANDFSQAQVKLTADYNDILKAIADGTAAPEPESTPVPLEESTPTTPEKTE